MSIFLEAYEEGKMKIVCSTFQEIKGKNAETLVLGIPEDQKNLQAYKNLLDSSLLEKIERYISREGFVLKKNEILSFDIEKQPGFKLFVGVLPKEPTLENIRQFCGRIADGISAQGYSQVRFLVDSLRVKNVSFPELVEEIVQAVLLSLYRYDRFKAAENKKPSRLNLCQLVFYRDEDLQRIRKAVAVAETIADGVNFTRDLVNTPPNELSPEALAEQSSDMAKECGLSFKAFGKKELQKMKMGGLLAVSQGSCAEPRLIVLEYGDRKAPVDFAFVGKGVTFDSGGISIKPSEGMEKMKYDMAGGASVIGVMKNASKLGLSGHIVGIIPAAENLPSGSAYRPGDVLWMGSGKSVEIVNTDAEGRLIMADGLFYAQQYKPKAVVDLATLTGACVVALGTIAIALLGNDESLVQRIKRAGDASGERVWEMPLWDDYLEQIRSDIAEIKNGGSRGGGTITGAMFLKQFVKYPWAHLDIAGTAWSDDKKAYCPNGASGVGVRLLTRMLRDWKKSSFV